MTEGLGRCPLCGGEKEAGSTTFVVDLSFGVVIVREVPASVCDQCGESWIDDDIASRLERVVADARDKRSEIEVTNWSQVAA